MRLTQAMAAALALLAAQAARAACESDEDCKGDKICVQGRCVPPREAPAPTSRFTPAKRPVAETGGGDLEVSWYLGGGGITQSYSAPGAPSQSSNAHFVMGFDFAGDLAPPLGLGGGMQIQYTNIDPGAAASNLSEMNVKAFLGPRLKLGPVRLTVGPALVLTLLASSKKIFAGGTAYDATHFGLGLYSRLDVLVFKHVGFYGLLGVDGTVYSDDTGASASQLDYGGGLIFAF